MFVWYGNTYAFRSNSDMGQEIETYEKCIACLREPPVLFTPALYCMLRYLLVKLVPVGTISYTRTSPETGSEDHIGNSR